MDKNMELMEVPLHEFAEEFLFGNLRSSVIKHWEGETMNGRYHPKDSARRQAL